MKDDDTDNGMRMLYIWAVFTIISSPFICSFLWWLFKALVMEVK